MQQKVAELPSKDHPLSTLAEAIGERNETKVKSLLPAHKKFLNTYKSADGYTLLHLAAWVGTAPTVRALLEAGADVNMCNRFNGASPLHMALYNKEHGLEIMKSLVAQGAGLDAAMEENLIPWCGGSHGLTPKEMAEKLGQKKEIIDFLVSNAETDREIRKSIESAMQTLKAEKKKQSSWIEVVHEKKEDVPRTIAAMVEESLCQSLGETCIRPLEGRIEAMARQAYQNSTKSPCLLF